MYILDLITGEPVSFEIVVMDAKSLPLKKDGWQFNWRKLASIGHTYVLASRNTPNSVEGALCLSMKSGMLFMEALELAPHNVGHKHKRYDHVAGCLIAYACRESFKTEGEYEGFLGFVSKTELIHWYVEKYGAKVALGQRMYFDPEIGDHLVKEYLFRKKTDQS